MIEDAGGNPKLIWTGESIRRTVNLLTFVYLAFTPLLGASITSSLQAGICTRQKNFRMQKGEIKVATKTSGSGAAQGTMTINPNRRDLGKCAKPTGEPAMPSPPPNQVVISYSHRDKKWRDDLETNLKPFLRDGSIVSWSDRQIDPGRSGLAKFSLR